MKRKIAVAFLFLLAGSFFWIVNTDSPKVFPIRNTLHYKAVKAFYDLTGYPSRDRQGSLSGHVLGSDGRQISGATVLVADWDGSVRTSVSDSAGHYRVTQIPVGFYNPVAGAAGFFDRQVGGILPGVLIWNNHNSELDIVLRSEQIPTVPVREVSLQSPTPVTCSKPVAGSAVRKTVVYKDGPGTLGPVFLYRPSFAGDQKIPLLLTVYPGAVDYWECVSVGLATAGYAVLAVGPEYHFDLTADAMELRQLIEPARQGLFQGVDGTKLAGLGGSYSALILEAMLSQDRGFKALILLGPPTDMFDMRRRFETESFMPPFGLDKALVALGFPNRSPMIYWQNSAVYHVRPDLPPTAIFHSYQDEIVPAGQSVLLAEALKKVGVEQQVDLFDGASHYLLESDDASQKIYERTKDFLVRHGMPPAKQ